MNSEQADSERMFEKAESLYNYILIVLILFNFSLLYNKIFSQSYINVSFNISIHLLSDVIFYNSL